MLNEEIMDIVMNGGRDKRVFICERSFEAFALYYFSDFFTFKTPAFHYEMYQDLEDLVNGVVRFVLWMMFRESAKTSITKMFVTWCIVYRKKRYICWDSYDKGNAEAALFDVANWLQTNKKLTADFGQLFFEPVVKGAKYSQKKSIKEFITANKVKVQAVSTQESTRGHIYESNRPDLYIVDDFETTKTKHSIPVTEKIIAHIDELKAGLSTDGQVIFNCNFITDAGSVAGLVEEARGNPDSWRFRRVDVVMDGAIMWPDKYVETDEEAAKANRLIQDRKLWKVSLHRKKKDLNAPGRKVFETEMMNDPASSGDLFFDRVKVDRAIAAAKQRKVVKEIGGFKMWANYNPKHRYGIGADTAKGVGQDSNASVLIDYATRPAEVVGTYANADIGPDVFAFELKREGDMFGQCLIAPEINNTGYATVAQLKTIYPLGSIYRKRRKEKVGPGQISWDIGWEATSATKADVHHQFKSAFEDGDLAIFDVELLNEMRIFTNQDLVDSARRTDGLGKTRHFDKMRAACIAWEMRNHALMPKSRTPYKQAEHVPMSDYQS